MAGRYKPYSEYKDSGVEWLGLIPSHWRLARIKESAKVINGYPFDSKLFEPSQGIPLVRIRDISSSRTEVGYVGIVPPESLISDGDVLIGMDGDFNVAKWKGGVAALNQRVACIRATNYRVQNFVFYALPFSMKIINDLTYYTTVKHLSSTDIVKTRFAFPPENELVRIVDFLDHETTKIDTLIEKQQQLIQLLKEKRQAVISHAVTKGLSSLNGGANAKLRDSGVEWLGEVPEHWISCTLRRYANFVDGDRGSEYPNEKDFTTEGVVFLSSKNIVEERLDLAEVKFISREKFNALNRGKALDGDLIVKVRGSVGRIGELAKFDTSEHGYHTAFINAQMMIIRTKSGLLTNYLRFISQSLYWTEQLAVGAYGTAQQQLSNDVFSNLCLVVPPEEEQRMIVKKLEQDLISFNGLIGKAKRAIDLMQERRTALISAAVTGKIDLRDWVAPQASPTNKEVSA